MDRTFIAGGIPPELGNLGNLTELSLETTQVAGPIPSELGRIQSLETLDLSMATALTGAMPAELCSLRDPRNGSLTTLRVGCNVACTSTCCTDYVCPAPVRWLRG